MDEIASAREITALAAESGLFPAPAGRKAELVAHFAAIALGGGIPSGRAACILAAIPPGSLGPWTKRDPGLKAALHFWRDDLDEEGFRLKALREPEPPSPTVPDFLAFRERHFAYIDRRTGKVVRATTNWYQSDAVAQLEAHSRLAMILPPGMIKTTLFGIEYPTWRIFRDRNFRGTVIQKNASEAAKLIASVKSRLEHDHYHWMREQLEAQDDDPVECPLCAYCPDEPFKPDSKARGAVWSQHALRVEGITSGEKEPTLQALGVESQLQGSRAEVILLDDVQSPTDALNSPKSSEDLMDWMQNTVLGRLYTDQKLVILANQITDDDFAARLVKGFPDWPAVRYPAVLPCPHEDCPGDYEACAHTDGRVLCPEVWDFPGLMQKRREVGEKVWFHQWELQSGGFDQRTFTREALEAARTEDYRLGEVPSDVTDTFIGVDPAAAASGYCAIVSWGLNRRNGQRFLIGVYNETGLRNWGNVISAIGDMARPLQESASATFRAAVIEETNVQTTLIQDERLTRLIRGMGAKVITYKTRTGYGATARHDSISISTIGGLFDAEMISLPYGGTVTEREQVDAYITQLCNWRTDDEGRSIKHLKRDMVMATLFAESEAFVLANRPAKPRSPRRPLPDFVKQRFGPPRQKVERRTLSDDEVAERRRRRAGGA